MNKMIPNQLNDALNLWFGFNGRFEKWLLYKGKGKNGYFLQKSLKKQLLNYKEDSKISFFKQKCPENGYILDKGLKKGLLFTKRHDKTVTYSQIDPKINFF